MHGHHIFCKVSACATITAGVRLLLLGNFVLQRWFVLFLRITEIDDFDVVVLVEHKILRLQIPVHNLLRPQVRKHVDKLGGEKADKIDVKFPSLRDQLSQVRVCTVLKDEV